MNAENFDMADLRNKRALFSEDRVYRYALWREWQPVNIDISLFFNENEPQCAKEGFVNFICLNPSTADENQDDPTIAKCCRLSKKWGYSGFCMTNLFAFRATDPEVMKKEFSPVGPVNTTIILRIAKLASLVICAWGNDGAHNNRSSEVLMTLHQNHLTLHRLKRNANGEPAHPLYLKETLIPVLFK